MISQPSDNICKSETPSCRCARKFQILVVYVLNEHRTCIIFSVEPQATSLISHPRPHHSLPTHKCMLKISQRLHVYHIVCIWINFEVIFGKSLAILMANILPRHFTLVLFMLLWEHTHTPNIPLELLRFCSFRHLLLTKFSLTFWSKCLKKG